MNAPNAIPNQRLEPSTLKHRKTTPPYNFAAGDEVGQTGFKFEHGSTQLFAVVIVLTNEPCTIQDNLDGLRRELGLPAMTEFKFHSTPDPYRAVFLERAATWPLAVRALCVDKPSLPIHFRKLKSWEFYGFFVAELLERIPAGELGDTTLILDEFGPFRSTLQAIRKRLRQRGLWGSQPRLFKRIIFRRSQSEAMIQVADMLGGAIYRWRAKNSPEYYHHIESKTLVWNYKQNPPT